MWQGLTILLLGALLRPGRKEIQGPPQSVSSNPHYAVRYASDIAHILKTGKPNLRAEK